MWLQVFLYFRFLRYCSWRHNIILLSIVTRLSFYHDFYWQFLWFTFVFHCFNSYVILCVVLTVHIFLASSNFGILMRGFHCCVEFPKIKDIYQQVAPLKTTIYFLENTKQLCCPSFLIANEKPHLFPFLRSFLRTNSTEQLI